MHPLAANATPVAGHFLGLVEVSPNRYARLSLRRERPTSLWLLGTELRTAVELRTLRAEGELFACTPTHCFPRFTTLRGSFIADLERPIGRQRLVLHTIAGAVGGRDDVIPTSELFYVGGPVSAPG